MDDQRQDGQTAQQEGKPAEELSTSNQPAEPGVGQLPDSAKEQTKEQFDKLIAHNKELSEKLSKYEQQPQVSSVLDEVRRPSPAFGNLSTAQVEDITKGLVDENGYIDQNLLDRTLKEANSRAQRAEDRAMLAEQRIEEFEINQTVRDVHGKYPALDPQNPSTFDPEFYNKVKNEIAGQLRRGYQDFEAAASKVAAEMKVQSASSQAKAEEQKKVLAQREQASTSGGGKIPSSPSQYEDFEDGMRKGDSLSIGQLLRKSGY